MAGAICSATATAAACVCGTAATTAAASVQHAGQIYCSMCHKVALMKGSNVPLPLVTGWPASGSMQTQLGC